MVIKFKTKFCLKVDYNSFDRTHLELYSIILKFYNHMNIWYIYLKHHGDALYF